MQNLEMSFKMLASKQASKQASLTLYSITDGQQARTRMSLRGECGSARHAGTFFVFLF